MTDPKAQQEPSMEEILASIRRIISEEGPQEGSGEGSEDAPQGGGDPQPKRAEPEDGPAKSPAGDDVLELTEMVQEDGSVVSLSDKRGEEGGETAAEDKGEAAGEPEPPPGPEPGSPPEPEPKPEAEGELVSAEAAEASTAAFAEMAEAVAERGGKGGTPLGESGRTLEGLVMEIMRPLLKAWLNENLPPLVERLVKEEIERMARRAEDR